MAYRFSDFDTSLAKLYGNKCSQYEVNPDTPPALMEFVGTRMKEIEWFAFLDYEKKSRIELPKFVGNGK